MVKLTKFQCKAHYRTLNSRLTAKKKAFKTENNNHITIFLLLFKTEILGVFTILEKMNKPQAPISLPEYF